MGLRTCSVLLSLFLLVGCGTQSDDAPVSYTDDLGRTVSIDPPVKRVVSLAPNITELVYAAGAGNTLVAVTSSGDYPPAVDSLPHISALPVDFEAIAAHEPDLILGTDQVNAPGDIDTFEALNLPIYFFSFRSLTDIIEAVETMGRLLDTETTATDSANALRREIESLRTKTGSIPSKERPRVLVLVGDETLYSFGSGSYVHTLVQLAGGRSITADIETQAPTLSDEYVLTEKPDVIVGTWGSDYDPDRLLELHPTWDIVPAVQNDRVYSLPSDLISRPGPRVLDGARRLAHYLHPDVVARTGSRRADTTSGSPNPSPSAETNP